MTLPTLPLRTSPDNRQTLDNSSKPVTEYKYRAQSTLDKKAMLIQESFVDVPTKADGDGSMRVSPV